MTPDEAVEVLARAAAYDNRTASRAEAQAWAAALPDIRPDAAVAAVVAWYGQHTERVMPGHVRTLTRGSDADRGPAARTAAEALAAADRADELDKAGDRFELGVGSEPGETPRERALRIAAEVQSRSEQISANWAMPSPTGFIPKRNRPNAKPLTTYGRQPKPPPAWDPNSTVCHKCVLPVPTPAGFDHGNAFGGPVYCGSCAVEIGDVKGAAG